MQVRFGQYKDFNGSGIFTFKVVLIVGLGPGLVGCVFTSVTDAVPGGTILLHLNLMKAFFTGRIPGDWRFLKPRINILRLNSDCWTLLWRLMFSGVNLKLKSCSTTANATKTSPHIGSLGENRKGCHLGSTSTSNSSLSYSSSFS